MPVKRTLTILPLFLVSLPAIANEFYRGTLYVDDPSTLETFEVTLILKKEIGFTVSVRGTPSSNGVVARIS